MYVTERCQELLTCQATSTPKKKKSISLNLNTRPLYRLLQNHNSNVFSGLGAKQTLERRFPGSFSRCGAEQVREIHQMKSALVDTVEVHLELKLA